MQLKNAICLYNSWLYHIELKCDFGKAPKGKNRNRIGRKRPYLTYSGWAKPPCKCMILIEIYLHQAQSRRAEALGMGSGASLGLTCIAKARFRHFPEIL